MVRKKMLGVALAALATVAAPTSAATFLGDNVVIKRVQGGTFVFKTVSTNVGAGLEYSDNFFGIDITGNQVIFDALGGTFSMGDIAYELSGLDFDNNPATPNLIEGFASTQIFNAGDFAPIGASRATITPDGRFRMSFNQVTGGGNGLAIITFGAPAAAVPEPATWAMMICGFALVGGSMRRARRRRGGLAAA